MLSGEVISLSVEATLEEKYLLSGAILFFNPTVLHRDL